MLWRKTKQNRWLKDELGEERQVVREDFPEEVTSAHRIVADKGKVVSHMKKAWGGASQAKGIRNEKALREERPWHKRNSRNADEAKMDQAWPTFRGGQRAWPKSNHGWHSGLCEGLWVLFLVVWETTGKLIAEKWHNRFIFKIKSFWWLWEESNVGVRGGEGEIRGKSRSKEDQAGDGGWEWDQEIETEAARRCQPWIHFKGRADKICWWTGC